MGIGKRLKEARLSRKLTQEELAAIVGVTKGAIANYENETSHPKEPVMYALMNALRVEPNFLFQDCVSIKNPPGTEDSIPGDEAERAILAGVRDLTPDQLDVVLALLETVAERNRQKRLSDQPSAPAGAPEVSSPVQT